MAVRSSGSGSGSYIDPYAPPYSNIPIPDPSVITDRVIREAKTELRSEFNDRLKAQYELLITAGIGRHEKALLRIDAVESANETFRENLNRVPTQLDRETERIQSLFDEKLRRVDVEIRTFREYAAALRGNADKAIEAAFTASEKVSNSQRIAFEQQIAKSESSFTKEIDSLKTLLNATKAAITADVANLTGRMDRGEGGSHGARAGTTNTLGLVAGAVGVMSLVLALSGVFHMPTGSVPAVGADTKRVDDLIAVITEQNRQVGQRMDALSARINALTPPATR